MQISLLWTLFIATFLFGIFASIVLSYHWRSYGGESKTIRRTSVTYFAGGVVFLLFSLFFIFSL